MRHSKSEIELAGKNTGVRPIAQCHLHRYGIVGLGSYRGFYARVFRDIRVQINIRITTLAIVALRIFVRNNP